MQLPVLWRDLAGSILESPRGIDQDGPVASRDAVQSAVLHRILPTMVSWLNSGRNGVRC